MKSINNYRLCLALSFVCPVFGAASEREQKVSAQEKKLSESIEGSRAYLAKGSSWDFEFADEKYWHRENIARCEKVLAVLREAGLEV